MKRILASAVLALLASPALAGEPYTAMNGYGASGYDVVAFFALSRELDADGRPAPGVPGRARFTTEHGGATYAFASEENRAAFVAEPARYLPRYDGHCAFGVSRGVKTAGAPVHWMIQEDALIFHGSLLVHGLWQEDAETNMLLGDGNWDTLGAEPAATDSADGFDPASAPLP